MIARLFALKLFLAIILTSCQSLALDPVRRGPNPNDLPNDCGITAAEAYSRLKATGCWTRIVAIKGLVFTSKKTCEPIFHILTAYQYDADSRIMLYDGAGSAELPTTSRAIKDIAEALSRLAAGSLLITEVRFLSP